MPLMPFKINGRDWLKICCSESVKSLRVAYRNQREIHQLALGVYGINIQCMKVTPYSHEDELFLNVEQIIPTPETKELMISMSAKEVEEKTTEAEQRHRFNIRLGFWEQALEAMRKSSCSLYANINATKDHWLSAGSGVRGVPYSMVFCKNEARVELIITRSEAEENKFIFDRLYEQKDKIEKSFGNQIEWERLNDKKASRIKFGKAFDSYNDENWPKMIDWLIDNMVKFEAAFKGPLAETNIKLKKMISEKEKQEVV